jgi:hypothetical protein
MSSNKYKFHIDKNIDDCLNMIIKNTDYKMIDIFFGSNIFISKIVNNNIILIARTFNSF